MKKIITTLLIIISVQSFGQATFYERNKEIMDSIRQAKAAGFLRNDSVFAITISGGDTTFTFRYKLPITAATQTALDSKQPTGSYLVAADIVGKLNADGNGSSLTGLTKAQVGLSNIDNTSDANKPVSIATQTALDLKAAASHSHTIANVTGLQAALDGKQATGSYLVAADITGKANLSGASFTGAMGYGTGAGGTITQATSKTTAVTLNKLSGQITMNGAALAAGAEVAFTLTNSFIAATDVIIVNVQSVGTAGAYQVTVGAVAAGSCSITVSNASAGSLSQAVVLNFAVIKSVNN